MQDCLTYEYDQYLNFICHSYTKCKYGSDYHLSFLIFFKHPLQNDEQVLWYFRQKKPGWENEWSIDFILIERIDLHDIREHFIKINIQVDKFACKYVKNSTMNSNASFFISNLYFCCLRVFTHCTCAFLWF